MLSYVIPEEVEESHEVTAHQYVENKAEVAAGRLQDKVHGVHIDSSNERGSNPVPRSKVKRG